MSVTLKQIVVPPGQQVLLKEVSWPQFQAILEELGESRSSRLSYSNGILEIIVPLPEHEKDKEIIGEIVRILLDALDIEFEALGSTTFENEQMLQAVEPDTCFYIKNYQAVIGKNRLNLPSDPPPDLAIEIDITSRTRLDNYRWLGVSELWRYTRKGLEIYLLIDNQYIQSDSSPNFPNFPIIERVNHTSEQCHRVGRSKAIKEFKQWLAEYLIN